MDRGRKKGKTRKGNGWASRKKSSTTAPSQVPPVTCSPSPYQQPRPSALQILSKESKRTRPRSSSSSSPSPANLQNLPPKKGPAAAPAPASVKLKRLQKQPIQEVQTPKNPRSRGRTFASSGPSAVTRRGGTTRMQMPIVCQSPLSLDMPDLSQLSTSPIFAQIDNEGMPPPPPPPLPLHKQGPYPASRPPANYISKAYPVQVQVQGQLPHGYGYVGGHGDGDGIQDILQVPVPYPRQRDMILSSSSYQPTDYEVLPPFQSVFGNVPGYSSKISAPPIKPAKRMHINPNQLVCLEVPTSAVQHFTPAIAPKEETSYQRMISQQEEEAKKEQRRVMLVNSERLKNILKLPKAHKWVIYEWFYSDIDRALFGGENDFQVCLRECFPNLRVTQMRRAEWCKIRGMMGKPRRSSCKFFEEEREQLAVRREKIRLIQRRVKVGEWGDVRKFLPEEIPMMLTIGTSVTARVRRPQDGIFQGTVEGVDPSNNTYRIGFGRDGLGAHSIPDYEVRAQTPPDTISTSSFCLKIPRQGSSNDAFKWKFRNAANLQEKMKEELPKSPFPIDSMLGGFPLRCLELIVRQSKLLKVKRSKIGELSELNVEAEKMKTYGRPYSREFRKRYAQCIVDLEKLNGKLENIMNVIQGYMEEIAEDAIQDVGVGAGIGGGSGVGGGGLGAGPSAGKMVYPEKVKEMADKEAKDIVTTYNMPGRVQSGRAKELIQKMASLMLQVKALGTETGDRKQFELQSIRQTVAKMKEKLQGENLVVFQNKVDIPLSRIMAGLCVNPKADDDKIN